MTKYWYDTEFLEDGKTIELISIGIVSDDGREYYAVNADMPVDRIQKHSWLMDNVWDQLPIKHHRTDWWDSDLNLDSPVVKSKAEIAKEVEEFLLGGDSSPELWAWYSAYDHVALAQLWGIMLELPDGIPMYTNDLRSLVDWVGAEKLPEQPSGLHNALEDARFDRVRHEYLDSLRKPC